MCPAVPMTTARRCGGWSAFTASPALGLTFALARPSLTPAGFGRFQVPLGFGLGLAAARAAIRLGDPHAVQDADQSEIDLPALHIHLDHLHAHLVAKPVDLAGVFAAHDVRALDEPVVVVGHRRHVHHALDEVLDQLDEEAEGGHAGDVTVELVADLVGHEAD